ncbi:MAG TPA: hypothetical protein EYP23_04420 [Thermoplasmata archaeon]|nr:hypothetical protein [Thermoplasmata archaeon]
MNGRVFGVLVCFLLLCIVLLPVAVGRDKVESETVTFSIKITTPEEGNLYAMGAQIIRLPFNWTVIIGPITVRVAVIGVDGFVVNFYIDEVLKFSDSIPPFEYPWWDLSFGRHVIKAELEGYGLEETIEVFKIF